MYKYTSLLIIGLLLISSIAFADALQKGEQFPNIKLEGKLDADQLKYLGLEGKGPWKITDIDADYLIVEIFSMYCPHCQKEAPTVNDLFDKLKKSKAGKRMKIIGVGAGNSEFEIDFFKKKYEVTLPLFSDIELDVHSEVGATGTPHFYLVKIDGHKLETLYSHAGRMDIAKDFLKEMKNTCKIK